MPLTWSEKARRAKPAHVVILEQPFAGIAAGTALLIPSPPMIAAYINALPPGTRSNLATMRADLARQQGAATTCPVTTAIHTRIVAEIALEQLAAGAAPATVMPFWRVLQPTDTLVAKLSLGPIGLRQLHAAEA